MKDIYLGNKLSLIIITLWVLGFTESCALLVKSQINKRFPPVTSTEKKIQAICQNIKLCDTTKIYDAKLSIQKKLIDSILLKTLKEDTKQVRFTDSRIDSLSINFVKAKFDLQELILESNQTVNFNYKKLKDVSYFVSGATSPYYSNDTLFINPFFNSVQIQSIKFKGLGLLTRRKIIYRLINTLLKNHIDNINGKIKNYFLIINPLPEDEKNVSSLVHASDEVVIENDPVIKFQKLTPKVVFQIEKTSLQLLLAVNKQIEDGNFICPGLTGLTKKEKRKVLLDLFDELRARINIIESKNFDPGPANDNYYARVKVRNGFLADNINYGFADMDFRVKMRKEFAANVPNSTIYVPKPDLGCPSWWKCLAIPHYCALCNAAKLTLRLLPSQIRVGSFGGKLDGYGTIHCKLGTILVANDFSRVSISKDLSFSGNLNYDFNYLGDGIGGILLSCAVLQFRGSPAVTGIITNPNLVVNIEKLNTDSNCIAKIKFEPITYRIRLNPSPMIDVFTNIRNSLSCNMSLVAGGFALGRILGAAFNLEQPTKLMDAALTGRYDSDYAINSIDYPLVYKLKTKYGQLKLKSSWQSKSINCEF